LRQIAIVLSLAFLGTTVGADDGCTEAVSALEATVVRLAAARIDDVLGAVADSTRALGKTYAELADGMAGETPPDSARWLSRRTTLDNTTGYRTWPDGLESPPAFRAPYPGIYSYSGAPPGDPVLRELNWFERLLPAFRSAYESFSFSWVYVTTADEAMMIYPYVPIEQAVNNAKPTQMPYYKAADFTQRAVGWTAPYLDLVGAGMMVTASFPIYRGDTLLGVMSRDITLKELADSVLRSEVVQGASALLVDQNGLVIDASDPSLAAEIAAVNSKAGAAVLHCRTAAGLQALSVAGAIASGAGGTNALVEQVLAQAGGGDSVVRFQHEGRRVLAARIRRTGWLLVLTLPRPS
jgi:hypothetical protein